MSREILAGDTGLQAWAMEPIHLLPDYGER
jgi:hypothetical protein